MINNKCKITNSSGKTAVILNAFNSSTNVAKSSTKQGYLQELKMLALEGGGMTLADGASATVVLDETYVDSSGKTRPCYIYDLLISTPDSLYPIIAVGESLDFQTMGYPDITITKAAADNMDKALNFCRNIMTSPSSKLSVGFQSAMTEAFKKGTVKESEQEIADFFNQYDTFAGLDFPSYVAVSTWLRAFAYLWGMDDAGKPGQTYYVYSAPEAGKKGASSEGTIKVTRKPDAPSPADPSDHNSGYDIELVAADGSKKTLTFDSGQFIDSAGGAVALNGAFGYKGTFTGKGADTTVWPIMSGMALNKPAIAIPLAPESGWDKFWDSLTFQKVLNYFMEAMGLWMALDFLKQKLTGKDKKLADDRANENSGADPSSQQQQEAADSGDEIGQDAAQEDQALADRAAGAGAVEVPRDDAAFSQDVIEARASSSSAYRAVATDNLSGGIDSARTQLDDLAQIEVTPAIEEAEGNLVDAQQKLSGGDLDGANASLGNVTEALPEIVDDLGDRVSAELKEQVEEAVEAQKEASEVSKESSENSDESESGDEEPFDDPVIPEEI